jgi:chromosome segregation ATPase
MLRRLALALATLVLALNATAAEPDKRLQQAREAARAAQAAAQTAQQDKATALRERDAVAEERDKLARAAGAARRDTAAQQARLQALETERLALQQTQAADQAQIKTLTEALQKAQDQVSAGTLALAEQRRSTAAVVALLQRSTAALARTEAANRQLHTLGLQAVEAWATRTPEAMRQRDEPFLQLGLVDLENEAEGLRKQLDALQLVP